MLSYCQSWVVDYWSHFFFPNSPVQPNSPIGPNPDVHIFVPDNNKQEISFLFLYIRFLGNCLVTKSCLPCLTFYTATSVQGFQSKAWVSPSRRRRKKERGCWYNVLIQSPTSHVKGTLWAQGSCQWEDKFVISHPPTQPTGKLGYSRSIQGS